MPRSMGKNGYGDDFGGRLVQRDEFFRASNHEAKSADYECLCFKGCLEGQKW